MEAFFFAHALHIWPVAITMIVLGFVWVVTCEHRTSTSQRKSGRTYDYLREEKERKQLLQNWSMVAFVAAVFVTAIAALAFAEGDSAAKNAYKQNLESARQLKLLVPLSQTLSAEDRGVLGASLHKRLLPGYNSGTVPSVPVVPSLWLEKPSIFGYLGLVVWTVTFWPCAWLCISAIISAAYRGHYHNGASFYCYCSTGKFPSRLDRFLLAPGWAVVARMTRKPAPEYKPGE